MNVLSGKIGIFITTSNLHFFRGYCNVKEITYNIAYLSANGYGLARLGIIEQVRKTLTGNQ